MEVEAALFPLHKPHSITIFPELGEIFSGTHTRSNMRQLRLSTLKQASRPYSYLSLNERHTYYHHIFTNNVNSQPPLFLFLFLIFVFSAITFTHTSPLDPLEISYHF
jgi:hypothetical protein